MKSQNNKNLYSNTIILPKTKFSMKAELSKREPMQIREWQSKKVFQKMQEIRKDCEEFILHDGPPYANGNLHLGHALNKILKDIVVKSKNMAGYKADMIAGWDCHGLPIEVQVLKEFKNQKRDSYNSTELRKYCRKYAENWIKKQGEDLSRFLCFWHKDNFYQTMSSNYEANIIKFFGKLFEKGFIYKDKRPVYWCIELSTSHAEAEVEYHEHNSYSIYVKFPVVEKESLYCLIWTTTPWTLPANLAICFNEKFSYAIFLTGEKEKIILAEALKEKVEEDTKKKLTYLEKISIDELKKFKFQHPFLEKQVISILGSHVTLDVGTGCVHTAPGHGEDDYWIGKKYNLEPFCPVDKKGKYTEDFPLMQGENIFQANPKIIELLKDKNLLFSQRDYQHSYPYSWRSKKPLVFLTIPQWFMKTDHNSLRENSIQELNSVKWIPEWGINSIGSMIKKRPVWCLSRQRNWGVPIPSFYCKSCGEIYLTNESIDYFEDLILKEGIEIWYKLDAKNLLKKGTVCKKCNSENFEKENHILDVWFDSGLSHFCVLNGKKADLYLEGTDQHRGWFQSSLLPSIALTHQAPYKAVLTHGYVLDSKGQAMSKSMGNIISPMEIIEKYGADLLRLWVSSQDFRDDNSLGDESLKVLSQGYRKIRNTFRYLLGNLNEHSKDKNLDIKDMKEIDLYYLSKFANDIEKIKTYYENYQFYLIYQRIVYFCNVELSQDYFEIIRDSLYCDKKNSQERLSSLTALYYMLEALALILAPILSFTSEEVWKNFVKEDSVFYHNFPDLKKFINGQLEKKWEKVFKIRDLVQKALEGARVSGKIGKSLEAGVILTLEENLDFSEEQLETVFVVSKVCTASNQIDGLEIIFQHTEEKNKIEIFLPQDKKCPRCWKYVSKSFEELCNRCQQVVKNISSLT